MTLPLLLSLADELDSLSTRSYADEFGFGMYPHRHYHAYGSRNHGLLPRHHHKFDLSEPAAEKVSKHGFQVTLDVQQFKPSELTVKTVDDFVVVEGKHEEREDEHGFISRHFVRRYALPKYYDPDQIESTLSSDGVLTIQIPPPHKSENSNERVIPIQHIGPAKTDENNKDAGSNGAKAEDEEANGEE